MLGKQHNKHSHNQIAKSHDNQHPPWDDAGKAKRENTAENQQTIRNGIENLPYFTDLIKRTGDDTINAIRSRRNRQQHQS